MRKAWPAAIALMVAVIGGYLALVPMMRSLDSPSSLGPTARPVISSSPIEIRAVTVTPTPAHHGRGGPSRFISSVSRRPAHHAATTPAVQTVTQTQPAEAPVRTVTQFVTRTVTPTPSKPTPSQSRSGVTAVAGSESGLASSGSSGRTVTSGSSGTPG